jgi:hydroxylamine reductase
MITKDTIIAEIIEQKPNAISIFMAYGMGCIGCPSAQLEKLEDACEIHGIDLEEILEKLNKV